EVEAEGSRKVGGHHLRKGRRAAGGGLDGDRGFRPIEVEAVAAEPGARTDVREDASVGRGHLPASGLPTAKVARIPDAHVETSPAGAGAVDVDESENPPRIRARVVDELALAVAERALACRRRVGGETPNRLR